MDMCDSATDSMQEMQSSDCSPNISKSSASSPADSELNNAQDKGTSPQYSATVESVYVPDLFSSIMAVKPIVNSNYHEVKPKADSWITRLLRDSDKGAARTSKLDITYLVSMWAPSCDEEALRVMADWNHWVFLFDDLFDEGHLSRDPTAAQEEIERTLAIMEDTQPPVLAEDNVIRYVFQTLWDRVKKRSSQDLQQRWKDEHRRYFDGLLEQVKVVHDQRTFTRDVQEYMDMRRRSIGVYPAIALTEYAQGVHLSQEIVDHPSLQECMSISADLVLMVNDITSYRKDLELGVDHNLITLLMEQGCSMQLAMNRMGTMFDDCYKRWYAALANMPVLGEEVDRQILKFVDACRNVALGNLYWSFKTGRYLGLEGDQIRETRRLNVVRKPRS